MRTIKIILIVLVGLSSIATAQYAEDAVGILENNYGFGARSISMGSAFTGVADDYSAIYWNPAGLAQIKRMEFFGGLSHLQYKNQADFYGTSLTTDDSFTKLSSLGLVFPVPTYRGSLVFAIGYQRVKDFDKTLQFTGFNQISNGIYFPFWVGEDSVDFYFDKNVQQEELVNYSGNLNNWSFSGAIDISPNVSAGAAMNFWTGEATYLFDFLQKDTQGKYPDATDPLRDMDYDSYSVSQKIISEYSAFQLKLATLIRVNEKLRLGANISLPTTFNVIERFNDRDELRFDTGNQVEEYIYAYGEPSEFEYDVSTPFQFNLGISYRLGGLLLAGSMDYVDISQVEFDLPDDVDLDSDYSALLDENKIIQQKYEEQMKLKAGAEYFWKSQNLKFRLGYMLDPSPLKDAPEEFDRQFITGGLGFVVDKQFSIDFAYMYGFWDNTSSDAYTPGTVTEQITYQKVFLTTSFRF